MKQPIFNDIIQGNISDIKNKHPHRENCKNILTMFLFVTWECFGGKNLDFSFFHDQAIR